MSERPHDPLVARLGSIVGPSQVLADPERRAPFETDWTRRYHGEARAVVRPRSTSEVSAVLQACRDAGAAVVPQGGNTGLVGGGVPRSGEIVLSTTRLAGVTPAARDSGELVAGAGTTLADAQAAARAAGWELGVDLAARDSATLGGMVATNAGGVHVLRHGPMSGQVLGLEAVLADGTVVGRLPALRKDNTGPRWAGILTGSEGTLAVVTRVHLRCVPHLDDRVAVLVALDDLPAAVALFGRLHREVPDLEAFEIFFADGLELVCAHRGYAPPFGPPRGAYALAEAAGPAGTLDALVGQLDAALRAAPEARGSAVAVEPSARARLWAYREDHSEAIAAEGIPHKLDVTVPLDRMAEFERAARSIVAALSAPARAIVFGHLGDGNLHVNLLGLAPDDDAPDRAILALAASMGGSISAEHGVGIAKRDVLALARTPGELAAFDALRRAWDPAGILNPGVLAPSPVPEGRPAPGGPR